MYDLTDDLLDAYRYADDPFLQQRLHLDDLETIRSMAAYDEQGKAFGRQMTAHQNRVARNGAAFLEFIGFSAQAAANFRAAMMFHDIGKTHESYDPAIWALEDRPGPEQKAHQKRHARLGADMWEGHAGTKDLQNHPHFAVRHAVTLYHHERIDARGVESQDAAALPVFVQVSCIVDAFDGDRIHRPHQPRRRTPEEALKRMLGHDGQDKYIGAFNPELMEKFSAFTAKKYSFTLP